MLIAERERHRVQLERTEGELKRAQEELSGTRQEISALTQARRTIDEERAAGEVTLEHESQRSSIEQDLKAITAQLNEAEKALSDQGLEVQSMDIVIRDIEPLAAAGRLSADLSRALLTAIADIDARSACLTAESATESSSREQIEQLRSDAVAPDRWRVRSFMRVG